MTPHQIILAIGCVLAICIGQILFKYVGAGIQGVGTPFTTKILALSTIAIAIYAGATIFWIHLLRFVPLSKAYPYMALSFVIVPILSAILFKEHLSAKYLLGIAMIVGGIVLIAREA
jgi:drug/metabolite transporter (DMT)-like permease